MLMWVSHGTFQISEVMTDFTKKTQKAKKEFATDIQPSPNNTERYINLQFVSSFFNTDQNNNFGR
jgi:hypothetical protein